MCRTLDRIVSPGATLLLSRNHFAQHVALRLPPDSPLRRIRERLQNIIEHAFVLCHGGLIESQHLPAIFRERPALELQGSFGGVTLRALEKMHISETIRRHGGNHTAAAKDLGINPSTLFRKIKSLGIELPEKDGRSGA